MHLSATGICNWGAPCTRPEAVPRFITSRVVAPSELSLALPITRTAARLRGDDDEFVRTQHRVLHIREIRLLAFHVDMSEPGAGTARFLSTSPPQAKLATLTELCVCSGAIFGCIPLVRYRTAARLSHHRAMRRKGAECVCLCVLSLLSAARRPLRHARLAWRVCWEARALSESRGVNYDIMCRRFGPPPRLGFVTRGVGLLIGLS